MSGQHTNVSNGTGATQATQSVFSKVPVGKAFKILKLPVELQLMIFKELLVMPGTILKTKNILAVDTHEYIEYPSPFVNPGLNPTQSTPGDLQVYRDIVIMQEDLLDVFLVSKGINQVCSFSILQDLALLSLESQDMN